MVQETGQRVYWENAPWKLALSRSAFTDSVLEGFLGMLVCTAMFFFLLILLFLQKS